MRESSLSIRIREYRPADWQQLCRIHDAARKHELAASVGTAAFLSLEQTAHSEGLFDGQLDVAEVDTTVRGFVAYDADEVTWLYVDPAMYRRGIGRALLKHALATMKGEVQTQVLEGNERALALYLGEGFEIAARKHGHLVGNEGFAAAAWLLRRRCSEDTAT